MSLLLAENRSTLVTRLRLTGGGALLLWLILALIWPHAAMRSYLFGYLFFVDLSLGMLGVLALQYATGGAWGAVARRPLGAGAAVLPLLAILGIPLVIGAPWLFPWADAVQIAADPVIAHRLPWIGLTWVSIRSGVFFVLLIGITTLLRKWSVQLDAAAGGAKLAVAHRLEMLSRFTLVAMFLIVSIWSVDFVMALEPHWVTTAFGMMMLCGQACTAMAVVVLTLAVAQHHAKHEIVPSERVGDLGKMLLTTLVLWAYISFAQFLINWLGNTQDDIPFFAHRMNSWWSWTGTALIFLHLGLPLILLLSAPRKRDLQRLARVAAFIFVMRWIDNLWMVAPSSATDAAGWLYPTDLLTPIAIGALWLSEYLRKLADAPLIATTYETSGANQSGIITTDLRGNLVSEVPHAG